MLLKYKNLTLINIILVKAAAKNGWIDEQKIVMENMHAFVCAEADIIISYHTREILEKKWL